MKRKETMLEHNNFKESLIAEINELQQQKTRLIKNLKQAPEGSLNVLEKAGKPPQYYWYQGRKERHYLPRDQKDAAKRLAQKAYDQQVLETIECRLQRALDLLQEYEKPIEKVYEEMPSSRRSLVTPLILSDEEYIRRWYEAHPGGQNSYPFYGEYYSNKGEQMRSKSELILADVFERYHVPYV